VFQGSTAFPVSMRGGLVSHSDDCNSSCLLFIMVCHAKAPRGISLPISVHTVSYMGVAFAVRRLLLRS
jgi:hypothetical protein